MANISTLGIGANLDLHKQMDQIEMIERRRLEPLTEQKKTYNIQISAFVKIQSSLEKLKQSAEDLKKCNETTTTKVDSEYKTFSAKTTEKAITGIHDIFISQLAKAQTISTKGYPDKTIPLGNNNAERIITISQPVEKDPIIIKLGNEHTSLVTIAAAINKENKSVNATIIKNNNNEYHLALTSKKEGIEHRININVEGDEVLNKVLNVTSVINKKGNVELINRNNDAIEQKVSPKNACLSIDGFDFETQSNTTKDLFPGLVLTLKQKSEYGKPESLVISNETHSMKEKIQAWVTYYNEFQNISKDLSKYVPNDKNDEKNKNNGPLIGNSTLRNIQNQLQSQVRTIQSSGNIKLLNQMGIRQNLDGTLSINEEKLDKILDENNISVKKFFIGDNKEVGFATNNIHFLNKTLDNYEGTLHLAKSNIRRKNKDIDKSIDKVNRQIESTMDAHRRKFQNLDKMMHQINSTGNSLTQLLNKSYV
ncbi:flagellar filament capping protein FliD [Providencia sneebia]|uniref:Flagellar hook-associated protein 2 n=1 Tax=Providencia sneebia DSM 19967 TaxID=1141660 RepID=K8WD71_9GAMM|nr:flagellar filament capping protein FliD [Providencia sneebia]EKT58588.1 flagellar capping protein [Providencia sneebia DSM 19967]